MAEKETEQDHPLDFVQLMYEQSSTWDDVERVNAQTDQGEGPTADYKLVTGEGADRERRDEHNLGQS